MKVPAASRDSGAGRMSGRAVRGQRVEEVLVGTGLLGPGGADHDGRDVRDPLGHEDEPTQRGGVGPVQVVGDQRDRFARR